MKAPKWLNGGKNGGLETRRRIFPQVRNGRSYGSSPDFSFSVADNESDDSPSDIVVNKYASPRTTAAAQQQSYEEPPSGVAAMFAAVSREIHSMASGDHPDNDNDNNNNNNYEGRDDDNDQPQQPFVKIPSTLPAGRRSAAAAAATAAEEDITEAALGPNLWNAAAAGDEALIAQAVSRDASVIYETSDRGHSLLYHASKHGHVDVVRLLLERGARDPKAYDIAQDHACRSVLREYGLVGSAATHSRPSSPTADLAQTATATDIYTNTLSWAKDDEVAREEIATDSKFELVSKQGQIKTQQDVDEEMLMDGNNNIIPPPPSNNTFGDMFRQFIGKSGTLTEDDDDEKTTDDIVAMQSDSGISGVGTDASGEEVMMMVTNARIKRRGLFKSLRGSKDSSPPSRDDDGNDEEYHQESFAEQPLDQVERQDPTVVEQQPAAVEEDAVPEQTWSLPFLSSMESPSPPAVVDQEAFGAEQVGLDVHGQRTFSSGTHTPVSTVSAPVIGSRSPKMHISSGVKGAKKKLKKIFKRSSSEGNPRYDMVRRGSNHSNTRALSEPVYPPGEPMLDGSDMRFASGGLPPMYASSSPVDTTKCVRPSKLKSKRFRALNVKKTLGKATEALNPNRKASKSAAIVASAVEGLKHVRSGETNLTCLTELPASQMEGVAMRSPQQVLIPSDGQAITATGSDSEEIEALRVMTALSTESTALPPNLFRAPVANPATLPPQSDTQEPAAPTKSPKSLKFRKRGLLKILGLSPGAAVGSSVDVIQAKSEEPVEPPPLDALAGEARGIAIAEQEQGRLSPTIPSTLPFKGKRTGYGDPEKFWEDNSLGTNSEEASSGSSSSSSGNSSSGGSSIDSESTNSSFDITEDDADGIFKRGGRSWDTTGMVRITNMNTVDDSSTDGEGSSGSSSSSEELFFGDGVVAPGTNPMEAEVPRERTKAVPESPSFQEMELECCYACGCLEPYETRDDDFTGSRVRYNE